MGLFRLFDNKEKSFYSGEEGRIMEDGKMNKQMLKKVGCVVYALLVTGSWSIYILNPDMFFNPLVFVLPFLPKSQEIKRTSPSKRK